MNREYIKSALLHCLDLSLPESDIDLIETRLLNLGIDVRNNLNEFSRFCAYLQSKGVDDVNNYDEFERFWDALDHFRKLEDGLKKSGQQSCSLSKSSSVLSKYGIPVDEEQCTEYDTDGREKSETLLRQSKWSIEKLTDKIDDSDKSDIEQYDVLRKWSDASIELDEETNHSEIGNSLNALKEDRFEAPARTGNLFSASLDLRPVANEASKPSIPRRFSSDSEAQKSPTVECSSFVNRRLSDHAPKTTHSGNLAKELRNLFRSHRRFSDQTRESAQNENASEDIRICSREDNRPRVDSALSEHERASSVTD